MNPPVIFTPALDEIKKETTVIDRPQSNEKLAFVLIFVTKIAELATFVPIIQKNLVDDSVLWFAYPKKTSKKYKSDITRDVGWDAIKNCNFSPVRQIAMDEDWSALRFRNQKYIKT